MNYTKEQEAILKELSGNLRILACAGSGKTEVVSRRLAKILEGGVNPKEVVCFTFTNKAADEMRSRIQKHVREVCPNVMIGELFVGTIHAFCLKLLKEYNHKYHNFDVLTENSRIAFIAHPDNYHRIGLDIEDDHQGKFKKISRFCESVDIFREELLSIQKVKSLANSKEENLFSFRYSKYLELLEDRRFIDYSGILFECYNMLKDPEVLYKTKNTYKFLVCDEYQDINQIQELIIEKIWSDSGNIFAVGDDDQAIYHWRGTKIKYFLDFPKRYKNAKSFSLSKNFRASSRIAAIANNVIANNNRIEKPMSSDRFDENEGILVNAFENETEEAIFIADTIKKMVGKPFTLPNLSKKNLAFNDFAILFRSVKNSASHLIEEFKREGIPFRVRGGISDLFESEEIDFIGQCFAYLADLEYRNQRYDIESLCVTIKKIQPKVDKNYFHKEMINLKKKLSSSKRLDLQRTYHKLLSIMGVPQGLYNDSNLMMFGQLSQLISEFENISYPLNFEDFRFFLGFVEGYAMDEYNSNMDVIGGQLDAVTISTIHRSKGLEFGFVFVPRVNNGILPSDNRKNSTMLPKECYDYNTYQGTMEDERRLFYVAITRAIAFISISFIKKKNGKNIDPSKFFDEITEAINKTSYNNNINQEKELKKQESKTKLVLSPSDVTYYLTCPYRFKLGSICQFNPGIDPAIGYGKQVHSIIEYLFKSCNRHKPNKEFVESTVDREFFLRFAFGKAFGNLKNKAKQIVLNYTENNGEDFRRYLFSERDFFITFEECDYKGIADLLLDSGENKIDIIDFKTREGTIKDFELQLRSYAIGIQTSYGYDVKSTFVHFLTNNHREKVPTSIELNEKTKKSIFEVARKIKSMQYPYSNNITTCKECDFKIFCHGMFLLSRRVNE